METNHELMYILYTLDSCLFNRCFQNFISYFITYDFLNKYNRYKRTNALHFRSFVTNSPLISLLTDKNLSFSHLLQEGNIVHYFILSCTTTSFICYWSFVLSPCPTTVLSIGIVVCS